VRRAVRAVGVPHTHDAAAVAEQVGDLGVAQEREGRLVLGGVGEQVEQVPLRHHRDVLVLPRQPAQVGHLHGALVQLHAGAVEAALGKRSEPGAQTQLVQQRLGGRVHGVAAEVAEEVGVLLQDGDLDARAGEEQPQNHPGWPPADHEAGRALVIRHALNNSALRAPAPGGPTTRPADPVVTRTGDLAEPAHHCTP
jgi:hypothetical protein